MYRLATLVYIIGAFSLLRTRNGPSLGGSSFFWGVWLVILNFRFRSQRPNQAGPRTSSRYRIGLCALSSPQDAQSFPLIG